MKKLTRGKVILIISIILLVVLIIITFNIVKNANLKKYKDFEEEIRIEAENYYEIKGIKLEDGEEIKVTLSELKNQKLISNELKNKCDGYAIISSDRDIYTDEYNIVYSAYIKCANKYSTANYSEY